METKFYVFKFKLSPLKIISLTFWKWNSIFDIKIILEKKLTPLQLSIDLLWFRLAVNDYTEIPF